MPRRFLQLVTKTYRYSKFEGIKMYVSWPDLPLHLFQSYAKPPLGLTTLIKMQSKGWAAH